MKRIYSTGYLCLLSCLMILMVGCTRSRVARPFPWDENTPVVDSLTQILDRGFFSMENPDSLYLYIADLAKIGNQGNREAELRSGYYKSFYLLRTGEPEQADSILNRLIQRTDSATNPYLYNRLAHLVEDESERTPQSYFRLCRRLEYFKSCGDDFMAGAYNTSLGNFMKDCQDPAAAAELYGKADSLYVRAGFPNTALYNKINRASALFVAHDSVAGVSLLNELRRNPLIADDEFLRMLVLHNLYVYANDTTALKELTSHPDYAAQPLVQSFISDEYLKKGQLDSAMIYARTALESALQEGDFDDIGIACGSLSNAFAEAGQADSAYYYLKQMTDLTEQLKEVREPEEMAALETARSIRMIKMERELRHQQNMLTLSWILFAVFLLLIIAVRIVYKRMQRIRIERINAQQERDRVQRELLAANIVMTEKDAVIKKVDREMQTLAEKGEISSGASGRLRSPIKTHLGAASSRENFMESFARLHPDYSVVLRGKYPSLTDTDIRFATFIVLGLDNKQIAATLGIRPESVKQARWRIRSKMGLQSGDSLEQALREYL